MTSPRATPGCPHLAIWTPLAPHAEAVSRSRRRRRDRRADRAADESTGPVLAEPRPVPRGRAAVCGGPGDRRASLRPGPPQCRHSLNNLAQLLQATNRLAEAEPLMRRALAIDERSYRPGPPQRRHPPQQPGAVAPGHQPPGRGRAADASGLAIDEQPIGPDHPNVATDLNNLAQLLQATNRLAEAEPLMRRALAIDERSFGPTTPTSPSASTTWRSCSRPPTAWPRPSR